MEELAKLEAERGNPAYLPAYRSQYGSVNSAGIIAPAIVATFVSTLTAVVYCKGKGRKRRA
ncbi:MAG: hypothetical protein K2K90_11060 [Lachnospiraceae bacterium]|nr:hypothetical protein [Lachnospiraceae bacterium]